jgi:hypothetical protein
LGRVAWLRNELGRLVALIDRVGVAALFHTDSLRSLASRGVDRASVHAAELVCRRNDWIGHGVAVE